MRAWQIAEPTGPAGLVIVDRPVPVPGPGEVVVRTRAVSLNYRDLLFISGGYRTRRSTGVVPCSDAAGDVVAVGPAVTRVAVGDRVTSTFAPSWITGPFSAASLAAGATTGMLAEHVVLPGEAVVAVPDGFSYEEASTLPCAALTAWHALFEETPFPEGATVLTPRHRRRLGLRRPVRPAGGRAGATRAAPPSTPRSFPAASTAPRREPRERRWRARARADRAASRWSARGT